jgi:hypothetical protein
MLVTVESSCVEKDPFWRPYPEQMPHPQNNIAWQPNKVATGVILSERHVLTAAHVVTCPVIPIVHVTLPSGRRLKVIVERDEAMFGDGRDMARLVILSAEKFEINAKPPKLASIKYSEDKVLCASTRHGWSCGVPYFFGQRQTFVPGMATGDGDSGAGVWDREGRLVGIVVARGEYGGEVTGTWVASVSDGIWGDIDETWLKGT